MDTIDGRLLWRGVEEVWGYFQFHRIVRRMELFLVKRIKYSLGNVNVDHLSTIIAFSLPSHIQFASTMLSIIGCNLISVCLNNSKIFTRYPRGFLVIPPFAASAQNKEPANKANNPHTLILFPGKDVVFVLLLLNHVIWNCICYSLSTNREMGAIRGETVRTWQGRILHLPIHIPWCWF